MNPLEILDKCLSSNCLTLCPYQHPSKGITWDMLCDFLVICLSSLPLLLVISMYCPEGLLRHSVLPCTMEQYFSPPLPPPSSRIIMQVTSLEPAVLYRPWYGKKSQSQHASQHTAIYSGKYRQAAAWRHRAFSSLAFGIPSLRHGQVSTAAAPGSDHIHAWMEMTFRYSMIDAL